MDIEVKMPDIGLDKVEVIEILVNINEKVKLEQGLITVEGDKTSMEIPSPISGVVKNIYIKIGEKITTNSLIMMFKVDRINSLIKKKKENYLKEDIDLNFKKN